MKRQNCWEFMQCGRKAGGRKESEHGVCPAFQETAADGINNGKNGGRSCWAVAGTLCENRAHGTFASKLTRCMKCDFYRKVVQEEGESFVMSREILVRIQKNR